MSNPFTMKDLNLADLIESEAVLAAKKTYQEQIELRRNEFCGKLLMCGLGPDKVTVNESCHMEEDGTTLIYSIEARYLESNELVELDDIYKEQESNPEVSLGIWEDPTFLSWFNSMSEAVRELIKKMPPDRAYRYPGLKDPVQLYRYDEDENGDILLTVAVHDVQRGTRLIQNVKPSDLTLFRPNAGKGE